jgi:phosphatidylglycerol:prolipoprotein diacylglycerol transferase
VTPFLVIEIPWDPNIGHIGGLLLTWHGLFTAIGILIGVQIALRLARVMGFDEDDMYTIALVAVPSGIVGARVLFVIEHWERFSREPERIIQITEGGISVWGALIFGFAGAVAFAFWRRYNVRVGLDAASIGLILGLGIGRLGDLVNGEHLSKTTDLPWAVVYTDPNSPAHAHSLAFGPHHPATTYEMFAAFAIFALLFPLFYRWLYRYPGVTFTVAAGGYAVTRFLLTYIRIDSPDVALGLRVPQVVALLTLVTVCSLACYWIRLGPEDREPPVPPGRIPVRRTERW